MGKKKFIAYCALILPMFFIFGIAIKIDVDLAWAGGLLGVTGFFLIERYFPHSFGRDKSPHNFLQNASFPKFLGCIYLYYLIAVLIGTILGRPFMLSSISLLLIMALVYVLICATVAKYLNASTSNKIAEKTAE